MDLQAEHLQRVAVPAHAGKGLARCAIDCDEMFGHVPRKCFQKSLLSVLHDRPCAAEASRLLNKLCQNTAPTGAMPSCEEARKNLCWSLWILLRFRLHVWVVAVDSKSALSSGYAEGRWLFGDAQGECAGSVLWVFDERHCYALHGAGVADMVCSIPDRTGHWLEPWEISSVGGKDNPVEPAEQERRLVEVIEGEGISSSMCPGAHTGTLSCWCSLPTVS